jgi:crotonobetainyl-CoA:carnitine CoA-transferase CaiB-like acyl-CoA transferase
VPNDDTACGAPRLELARILAGPWAGQTLADLGADVIKVESARKATTPAAGARPSWSARATPPPRISTAATAASALSPPISARTRGASGCWTWRGADVLIENFKLGGLAKYGLDYDSLSEVNPGLIYCSITGFGQTGPYAHRAGYDYIIQGMSGIMSVTGAPDGQPQKVGIAVTDILTGLYSVNAILAALHLRTRRGAGSIST